MRDYARPLYTLELEEELIAPVKGLDIASSDCCLEFYSSWKINDYSFSSWVEKGLAVISNGVLSLNVESILRVSGDDILKIHAPGIKEKS